MTQIAQARARLVRAILDLNQAAEAMGVAPVAESLRAEAERLESARFVLALVGERLTGKSTLVNALLGNPVLPARPVPTTALVTEVVWAEHPRVTLGAADGVRNLTLADLAFLTEGAAGLDRSARLRVGFPAEILREGIAILDTPGTNDLSTLGAELTYGVLPDADAVVVVLDATQPLRRTEKDFLRHRLPRSARDRTVVVLHKADLLGVGELREAREYAAKNLAPILPPAPIFAASAKLALERGDRGFDAFRAHLGDLVGRERMRLTLVRSTGEAARLGEALRDHLRVRREAARLAAEEVEARLARLRGAAGASRRAAHEACALVDERAREIGDGSAARLADFSAAFEAALPREIEKAEEEDLRRYLPFFLEDTFKKFIEGESARIEAELGRLAYEALAELAEKGRRAAEDLDLAPGTPLRVEVDTTRYDAGVFAAGVVGTILLFKMPLLGILVLAGAPVLSHVLRGKVAGRVREVAREQALQAVREARARIEEKLREAVLEGAARIKEAVLSHGEESARGLELGLEQALAEKRGAPAAPADPAIAASVEAACEELARLGEELTQRS
jgi:hypothetical protein